MQPPREDPNDPMGCIPMYMCSVSGTDATRKEPVQDKIIRLQKTLGGAFNGMWAAWVKRAALRQELGGSQKHDPKLNT
eukprot:7542625-Pyramimonas_sp.AAC.1